MGMLAAAIIAVAFFFAAGILAFILVIRKILKNRSAGIGKKFEGREILFSSPGASYFGRESAGLWQVRGNGDLIITPREVYFEMWFPKRILVIPLGSVESVETPKSFKGRSVFRPLLKITFRDETGRRDSVAWYVKDLRKALSVLSSSTPYRT
jgi:hypothetical protein